VLDQKLFAIDPRADPDDKAPSTLLFDN